MAFFKNIPDDWQRLDWQILQNGWASLYWQQDILDKDIHWFEGEGFKVYDFDCTSWSDLPLLHKDLKNKLGFPDYYGENLAALNDCLSDLEINNAGVIIVFRHFQFVNDAIAHSLLDVFANNSRQHILLGKKLITLVQVDDPNYQIDAIGACNILWNRVEWQNSARGL